jgi:hypothetical protein
MPTMYPRSARAFQADALFASVLQRSDEANASQVRRAIAESVDAYGDVGCACQVAQEFGDHPEMAAARMRWALATVEVLEGQPVPARCRIAAA